jgi:hypothetical protein
MTRIKGVETTSIVRPQQARAKESKTTIFPKKQIEGSA